MDPRFPYITRPTSPDPAKALLDHVIILVPYGWIASPPEWLTSNFTITPGGRHADNKTDNSLILFQDGSYIELIAFIDDDPNHRVGHWWGDKQIGIVDFAFTSSGSAGEFYSALQTRLDKLGSLGVGYDAPKRGGRLRPDGEELKWEVTFPRGVKRGELPFFCHDVTSRELRVPRAASTVNHPCMAYGIKGLRVLVDKDKVADLAEVYAAVLGVDKTSTEDEVHVSFEVGRVRTVEHTDSPVISVQPPDTAEREFIVAGRGVLLGDLVLGGISTLASGPVVRQDREDLGRIFLELDLPPGYTRPEEKAQQTR